MHCHGQIAAAAFAALNGDPAFAGRGQRHRMSAAEREKLPLWSVYVARARNSVSHQENVLTGALEPVVEREIELALVMWVGASFPLRQGSGGQVETPEDEAGRLSAVAERVLATDPALTALVLDGLVYAQSFDLAVDPEQRGFATVTLIFRLRVLTPLADAETILN